MDIWNCSLYNGFDFNFMLDYYGKLMNLLSNKLVVFFNNEFFNDSH